MIYAGGVTVSAILDVVQCLMFVSSTTCNLHSNPDIYV